MLGTLNLNSFFQRGYAIGEKTFVLESDMHGVQSNYLNPAL